jgi:peptidoglycan hydrolase-like protein with peptidoglycan-binding domain
MTDPVLRRTNGPPGERGSNLRGVLIASGLVLVGLISGIAAGQVALVGPADPLEVEGDPITYRVVEGEVGRTLSFAAIAEWEMRPAARGGASGVVTTIDVEDGLEVDEGDVLFTVDLRPVVIAEGEVPAFRDLEPGMEGPDVAQLQHLLSELGYYGGEVDGRFGGDTAVAVRAWQEAVGATPAGVVPAADLVFVEDLPSRIALDEQVDVGNRLNGGEHLVYVLGDEPTFRIRLGPDQRQHVPEEAEVRVFYEEGRWASRVGRIVETDDDRIDLLLEGPDGAPVCGDDCADWVPVGEQADFVAEVVVVPEARGPVVPVAAIQIEPDNQPYVTLASGEAARVEIVAASAGVAVVDGIEIGQVLRLPFEPPPEQIPDEPS